MADQSAVPVLRFGPHDDTEAVNVDVPELLRSKLLIAGGSGSGKSHALRALLEQMAGTRPLVVFDFEGELVTLAEVHPILIAGDRGHVPAHPDHAARLAERIAATGASIVLNLSELTVPDRQLFVARYLEAMMALPREAWRSCLIAIDEVQLVCPERTDGDPVSAAAVVDVAARGRKRGYGLVVATQRIAKVRKDLVAECHNRLFGFITLPADVKAAGGELGLDTAGRRALTQLPRGHFFAQGPAISRETVRVCSAPASTKAPASGVDYAPAAPADVQALLEKLGDFSAPADKPDSVVTMVHGDSDDALEEIERFSAQVDAARDHIAQLDAFAERRERMIEALVTASREYAATVEAIVAPRPIDPDREDGRAGHVVVTTGLDVAGDRLAMDVKPWPQVDAVVVPASVEPLPTLGNGRVERLPARQAKAAQDRSVGRTPLLMLAALYQLEQLSTPCDRALLAAWVGLTPSSGTYRNYLSELKRAGLILTHDDGRLTLTADGHALGSTAATPFRSRMQLHDHWYQKLGRTPAAMLRTLVDRYPKALTRDELAAAHTLSAASGTFRNYLSELRRPQLIVTDGYKVRASGLLFPAGLPA